LAAWYDEYGAKLYGYLCALLSNPDEAEEALQEVFTKVYAKLEKGLTPDDAAAYLFRAARNEAYSRLRRRRFTLRATKTLEDQPFLLAPSLNGRPTGEREALERALHALPPKQREVVSLRTFQGMTFHETADILGVSPNTAASRYRYALDKLRQLLSREDFTL
jgi:RNA polymerase sigma-70 factor, ECF subfamily